MEKRSEENGKAESVQGTAREPNHVQGGGAICLQALHAPRLAGAIKGAMDAMNAVGRKYRNNTMESRAGHVAEAFHTGTFNVDSACNRSIYHAKRLDSRALKSPDIVINKGQENILRASVKNYKDPARAALAQQGYGDQLRLVPKDQLGQVKALALAKIAKMNRKDPAANQESIARLQEVEGLATDALRAGGNESTPLTHAESLELAERAKAGTITVRDMVGPMGKRLWQGAKSGAKYGAAFAGFAALLGSIGEVARDSKAGKSNVENLIVVLKDVAAKSLDGAVKGAIGGAATTSAQLLVAGLKSGLFIKVLKGALPATIGIFLYEVSKDAVRYKQGNIAAEDVKRRAKLNASYAVASLIGARLGKCAGPLGALAGAIVLPMLLSFFLEPTEVSLVSSPALALSSGRA